MAGLRIGAKGHNVAQGQWTDVLNMEEVSGSIPGISR